MPFPQLVGSYQSKRIVYEGAVLRHTHTEWSSVWHIIRVFPTVTACNKTSLSQIPGNRIVIPKRLKRQLNSHAVCPSTLWELCAVRPKVLRRLYKTKKHVSRVYGGSMCVKCVGDRIRWAALLTEEEKIVVEVLKAHAQSHKAK